MDEGWESVKRLIELARKAPTTLSPERRERIRQGLLERLWRDRLEAQPAGQSRVRHITVH